AYRRRLPRSQSAGLTGAIDLIQDVGTRRCAQSVTAAKRAEEGPTVSYERRSELVESDHRSVVGAVVPQDDREGARSMGLVHDAVERQRAALKGDNLSAGARRRVQRRSGRALRSSIAARRGRSMLATGHDSECEEERCETHATQDKPDVALRIVKQVASP